MAAKMVAVFGLLLIITATIAVDEETCTTSQCKTERRHSMLIQEYRKELSAVKRTLQESSCSICNVEGTTPCYNNGTCIPQSPLQYICECPDNTAGDHCEDLLSCQDSNPCGHGAVCTVFNHKKVCSCPPGTSGDPLLSCDLRSKQACLSGDPHFRTFDGTTFDYQGSCPYYIMTSCNSSDEFSIIGTNLILSGTSVAVILEMSFKFQGHTFKVDSAANYFIDGIRAYYPNYWPSQADPRVVATKPSNQVIIQDSVHSATITFTPQSTLCIDVPLTSFFYGSEAMCGLMGNIDDECTDDVKAKDGAAYPASTCTLGTNLAVLHVQDTWIVNNTVDNCQSGEIVANLTNCDTPTSQNTCDLIRQAISGQGPFGDCIQMGVDNVTNYFHDCSYDVCHGVPQCDALDTFATLCINQIPFANIDNWRSSVNCPYTCPPHSTYSMKTPRCQNTCADHNYSNSSLCQDSYEEGCICDPGYYFDSNGNTNGFTFVCRQINDCGCVDSNGNYDLPDSHWLNANCTVETQCFEGVISSEPTACSIDGACNTVNGFSTCQCLPGYSGDGYNCSDIDECKNNANLCNANLGQGLCTNLPGTYECTCLAPYSGDQCQDYTPSRHCADLQIYHGITVSGTYNITIGANYHANLTNDQLAQTLVYCDMDGNGGGWTLMSHGNGTSGQTFASYVAGFGDPDTKSAWLGLDNTHAMTQTPTSLRVVIERCASAFDPDTTTECTYNYFAVSDPNTQYAVFLNSSCVGTEYNRHDAWVTWNPRQLGPGFVTFDNGDIHNCSSQFHNTGWWFNYINDGAPCGTANLNGLRYVCGGDETPYMGEYLEWARYPVEDAYMYLRPRDYPNYDSHDSNLGGYTTDGYSTTRMNP